MEATRSCSVTKCSSGDLPYLRSLIYTLTPLSSRYPNRAHDRLDPRHAMQTVQLARTPPEREIENDLEEKRKRLHQRHDTAPTSRRHEASRDALFDDDVAFEDEVSVTRSRGSRDKSRVAFRSTRGRGHGSMVQL